MILYFADRGFSILGYASTNLPDGLTVFDDNKTEEVETGVAIFECKLSYTAKNRYQVEQCTAVGNYILRKHDSENEFYTIIDSELDTKNQEVYIYAEDAGLDLLNEVVGAYTANQAYPITHYVEKFTYDSGFEIGINEATGLTRTLSWDGEATATERLASVATQFGGFEVSYSFDIKGLEVTNKYINIYKERGKESGVQLRLNNEIDRIVTKKSIANLATALICTGGTPENSETPITLSGYEYDDGDFYVSGKYLYSREALKKWTRYVWNKEPNQIEGQKGHIVQRYSYDTTSQKELCAHAVTELKKLCEIEVNYEIDINMLPENVAIGDRVDIVDDAGELYVSARILKLETSVSNETQTATIGEYLIKNSGISQKVSDLASEFSEFAKEREESDKKLEEASQAAKDAQEAADNAQSAADEAAAAAAQAKAEAANASAQLEITETKAETAIQKAEAAQSTAEQASTEALDAKSTADAAKLDAAAAQEDINSLGDRLTTVTTTMEADYARKTDLTEAEAHLQSQISQNAAEISSTVTKVQKIDETANNAAEQASQAQTTAQSAKEQAEAAAADAEAAQTAAENAVAAATDAQTQANTAKQAAEDAQTNADAAKVKADQAQTDLEAAKANLDAVSSKADATEAEVAAAQQAVVTAQAAADKAAADAAAAQTSADQAAADAIKAQTAADNAKNTADAAQAAADKAQADADAAQAAADALAIRVTSAETKITQNSEKIELAATKTEVAQTLGGYYTKEQTDAAIKVQSDNITLSVSNLEKTVSGIKIGGRNLIVLSSATDGYRISPDGDETSDEAHQITDYFIVYPDTEYTLTSYAVTSDSTTYISMEWLDSDKVFISRPTGAYVATSILKETYVSPSNAYYCRVSYPIELKGKIKMESGNKSTDWTPAPEDVETEIGNAQSAANQSQSDASSAHERIDIAESIIQQLSDCISMLVTDENGASLMTQTENGWTFSMAETSKAVSDVANSLDDLIQETGDTQSAVEKLSSAVNDLGELANYVKITTSGSQPCIELGTGNSDFKLLITNTDIRFMEGSSVPAYINNQSLYIKKAVITEELRQGNWSWQVRANGNLGLVWKGSGS